MLGLLPSLIPRTAAMKNRAAQPASEPLPKAPVRPLRPLRLAMFHRLCTDKTTHRRSHSVKSQSLALSPPPKSLCSRKNPQSLGVSHSPPPSLTLTLAAAQPYTHTHTHTLGHTHTHTHTHVGAADLDFVFAKFYFVPSALSDSIDYRSVDLTLLNIKKRENVRKIRTNRGR